MQIPKTILDRRGNTNPPFAKHSSTEGQTKKWKGKTYYYCPKSIQTALTGFVTNQKTMTRLAKMRKYKENASKREKMLQTVTKIITIILIIIMKKGKRWLSMMPFCKH